MVTVGASVQQAPVAPHGAHLLGRAKELAVLTEALHAAAGGEPFVVTVDGPAGIGKSALIHAFAADAARGAQVFWLRCDRSERDVDYAAVELLLGAEVPAERGEIGVARELLSRLDDVAPRPAGVSVLIVDDAHWMDLVSARSLRFALRRLQQDSLLTIVCQRPGFPSATKFETADPAHTVKLQLAPLAAADVVTLARDLRRWRLALPAAERLVQLTGGIPLLLDLLLRCAADPTQLTSGDVPGSAVSSTMQLLSSLDADSRRLVEAASVLGEPAEDTVLRTIAFHSDEAEPSDGIAQAVGAGLLVGHRSALSIPHTLLSQAVYDSLAAPKRRRLHQRAAQWTTGSRRLEHRASAAETADPRLSAELIAAARAARTERRYAQAAVSTERARLLSSDAHQRDQLLLQALLDRVAAQDLRGAERLGRVARALPPSALRGLALGLLCRERGLVSEADEHLRYAVNASLASVPSLHPRAALALAVLQNRLYQGAAAARTLRDVRPDDDPELACDVESNRAISLWQSGHPDEAAAVLADRTVSPHATAWEAELLAVRGMVRHYTGALSTSLDDLDASIGSSSLWRPSTNQVRVYVVRSRTRFQLGDWDGAAADAETAQAIASGQTELWNVPLVSAAAMLVPTWRGQWATAQRHLDEGRAAVSPALWKGSLGAMVRLSAFQLLEARGERDQLLAYLEPMLTEKELESLSAFRSYLRIVPAWIEACLQAGRLGDARRGLIRYEQLLLRWPGGPEAARIGLLRGLVAMAGGDAVSARLHFADDFADPQVRARPFQLARLHHAAGRLEVLTGDHQAAVTHLTDAMAGFTRLGAVPLQESCRADLGGIGAADVRPPGDLPWGLTARESVVAAFVRRGFTNKEIAREMIVTVKAVEYHLTRIYAKAGVHGRHELRCALTTEPEPGAR